MGKSWSHNAASNYQFSVGDYASCLFFFSNRRSVMDQKLNWSVRLASELTSYCILNYTDRWPLCIKFLATVHIKFVRVLGLRILGSVSYITAFAGIGRG